MSAAVSIVIPVHGHAELTRRCLDAVLATAPGDCEIVVVDDASPDDTLALLAGYGEAVKVVALDLNAGYATACNRGVEESGGELIVLLNNDTEPAPGWLDALTAHAREHPAADVVGAKLTYPTGTVQHAGVVFGQDGYPHNLYAGFPADHPAVERSRRLQAVTGACALVRRDAFERAGGFDSGFRNSLEDVDLCLRIGAAGGEVHYCHQARLRHLESASRGREDRFAASVALYRERWRDRVRRDDLAIYAEDGLIEVEYPDAYPIRLAISPRLAVVDRGRDEQLERLLETYAGQVSDLLQEVVRLTAAVPAAVDWGQGVEAGDPPSAPIDHELFLAQARRLAADVEGLQRLLEPPEGERGDGFSASGRLGYRELVAQIRAAIAARVPAGATVLVASRGDRELVRIDERRGWHFPRDTAGNYLGHHPADSDEAIEQLESLRAAGARYLVLPATSSWWLEHYSGFAGHLGRYDHVDCDVCAIYDLDRAAGNAAGANGGRRG